MRRKHNERYFSNRHRSVCVGSQESRRRHGPRLSRVRSDLPRTSLCPRPPTLDGGSFRLRTFYHGAVEISAPRRLWRRRRASSPAASGGVSRGVKLSSISRPTPSTRSSSRAPTGGFRVSAIGSWRRPIAAGALTKNRDGALPAQCLLSPKATIQQTCPTGPSWAMCGRLQVGKENLHVAGLVGAAMCSAFECGSHDRWP